MQHGHQSQPPGSQENLQHSREYVRKIYELTDFYNKVIIFCAITFIVSARQRDSLGELGSADTDPRDVVWQNKQAFRAINKRLSAKDDDDDEVEQKEWKELIYLINSQLLYCDYITFKRIIADQVLRIQANPRSPTTDAGERGQRRQSTKSLAMRYGVLVKFYILHIQFTTCR